MAAWYVGSTKWTAVTAWAASTAYSVGDIRRQLATPTVGNERVWRCTTAGTSGGSEPSWTLTKGSTTNDNGVVWTEITGNSTYNEGATPWGAPHARITNVGAWMAAGDTCYISNNHAATAVNIGSLNSPGTAASPCNFLCVNDSAAPPTALATTATEAVTGNSVNFSFSGVMYVYGVGFSVGEANTNGSFAMNPSTNYIFVFDTCKFTFATIAGSGDITAGQSNPSAIGGCRIVFKNCVLKFAAVAQGFLCYVPVYMYGGSVDAAGTAPTTLFKGFNGPAARAYLQGVDLSFLGSGKNWFAANGGFTTDIQAVDCKAGSSVSFATGAITGPYSTEIRVVNCDSADTNYRYHKQTYQGTITQETTIVRTGGASDGTTPISRKMVSTANSKFYSPLESDWIVIWNETLSSLTATLEVVTDGVTLTDAEAWIEVEYLGTSGFPLGGFVNDRAANILATPANQTTSSETWTTTGLSSPVKQKLAATFTPVEKGPIRARICLAKASTTMYVCPKLAVA